MLKKLTKLLWILGSLGAVAAGLNEYSQSTIAYKEAYLVGAIFVGIVGALNFILLIIEMARPKIEGYNAKDVDNSAKQLKQMPMAYGDELTIHNGEQNVFKLNPRTQSHQVSKQIMDKIEVEASESVRNTLSSLASEKEVTEFITKKYPNVPKWMIDKLVIKELKRRGIIVG